MLGQGLHKKRLPSRDKSSWVCLIATLTFCLWCANALPIQRLEYQLTTNLAISTHRLPMLQSLARNTDPSDPTLGQVFSKLDLEPDDRIRPGSGSSDLRSVRVTIRCPNHCDIQEIEKALNELTVPSMESAECLVYTQQLQKERWLLESSAHSIKRLELDLDREKNAIETDRTNSDGVSSQDSPLSRSSSPFQLTSFGASDPSQGSQSGLLDSLRQLNQIRSENVESMLLTLDRLKVKARGFVSLTGSPKMHPLVRPLTRFRFFVLCTLAVLVWLLLMAWLHSISTNTILLRKSWSNWKTKSSRAPPPRVLASNGIEKTIHWLKRGGIHYLGAIQVLSHETTPTQTVAPIATEAAAMDSDNSAQLEWSRHLSSVRFLRSMSEGSLVLWIGLFAARIMFDPVWRELVVVAPLAALSRMISGT